MTNSSKPSGNNQGNNNVKESINSPRRKTFSKVKIDHAKTPDSKNKTSEKQPRFVKGTKFGFRYLEMMEPVVNAENVPEPPASTVLSSAIVPEGGRLVSVRGPEGKIQLRIEYDRAQLIEMAASPFAALPPACIKTIVEDMPELIAPFPVRHFCG